MPTPTITIPDVRNVEVLGQVVRAKTAWSDDWEEKPHVHAVDIRFSASPTIGSAVLRYRYGRGRQTGTGTFLDYERFTLPTLAYVQIELTVHDIENDTTKQIFWYGVAGRLVDSRGGADTITTTPGDPPTETPVPFGVQEIHCAALEWLLDRHVVTQSWVRTNDTDLTGKEILRALTFNDGGKPNRSETVIISTDAPGIIPVFAHGMEEPEFWSTKDIVKYLLSTQTPNDFATTYPVEWAAADGALDNLPAEDRPTLETEGVSTLALLNRLIPRQRGLGFYFTLESDAVDASSPQILLNTFTFAQTEITLPDTTTIPANGRQIDLELSGDRSENPVTYQDAFAKYHQIRARGRRVCFVFTSSLNFDTALTSRTDFIPSWLYDDEVDYLAGADDTGTLPSTSDPSEREQAIRRYRSDPRFKDVYRKFQLSESYFENANFLAAGYAPGLSGLIYLFVDPDETDLETDSAARDNLYIRDWQINPKLPIVRGLDYSTEAPEEPSDVKPDQLLEPFVSVPLPDGGPFPAGKYIVGNAISRNNDLEKFSLGTATDDSRLYCCDFSIEPIDSGYCAFNVNVTGGPQSGHGWDIGNAYVTVAVFTDRYCEVFAFSDDVEDVDLVREKVIYYGDKYQLNVMTRGCIFGIGDEGDLKCSDATRIIRDDRDALRTVAKRAMAWYGQDRQAIKYSTSYLNSDISLGTMVALLIDSAEAVDINTVVTAITFQYPVSNGRPGVPRMSFETNQAELDAF